MTNTTTNTAAPANYSAAPRITATLDEARTAFQEALRVALGVVEDDVRLAIFKPDFDVTALSDNDETEDAAICILNHVERVLARMGTAAACIELMRTHGTGVAALSDHSATEYIATHHPRWSIHGSPQAHVKLAKQVITEGIARVRRQLSGEVLQ